MRGAKAAVILAAMAVMSAVTGASAQTSTTPPATTTNRWHRVCDTDPATQAQVCHVGSDLWNARGDIIATVAVRTQTVPGQPDRRIFVAVVPIGVLVQPRLRVEIDGRTTREVPFDYCDQTGCYATIAENPADPASTAAMNALIADIRARNQLTLVVSTASSSNPVVRYPFSLTGTSATFTGPALTPQQLIDQTNQTRATLQAQSRRCRRDSDARPLIRPRTARNTAMTNSALPMRRLRASVRAIVALAAMALSGTVALAQGTTPPTTPPATTPEATTPTPEATQPVPRWLKICEGNGICFMQMDITEADDIVASVRIDISGMEQPTLQLLLPMGVYLRPGFAYAVDDGSGTEPQGTTGQFLYCGPVGGTVLACLGNGPVTPAFIQALRTGVRLIFLAYYPGSGEEPVALPLDLAEFAAVLDGPAITPNAPATGTTTTPPATTTTPPATE